MLSQTCEYALRALACMAAQPAITFATAPLGAQAAVPATYLAKVLQTLSAAGLVEGRRGVGGGYRLARPPHEITLANVAEVFGPLARAPFPIPIQVDPDANAAHTAIRTLERVLESISEDARATLNRVTLADLVTPQTHSPPSVRVRADAAADALGLSRRTPASAGTPNIVADGHERRDEHPSHPLL